MTELMKRYETETGERATFVYIEKDSEGREKSTNITTGGFDVWVMGEAERLNEINTQLKDQLRWRPVSEKPKKKTGQILCKRQVKVNSKEFTRLYPADMCDIEDWAHFVKKLEIVSYLPIPPAPEGE